MTPLDRRLSKLERASNGRLEIGQARSIVEAYHAYFTAGEDVDALSASHRALVAVTSREAWQRALVAVIDAVGGLEVVVRESIGLRRQVDAIDYAQ